MGFKNAANLLEQNFFLYKNCTFLQFKKSYRSNVKSNECLSTSCFYKQDWQVFCRAVFFFFFFPLFLLQERTVVEFLRISPEELYLLELGKKKSILKILTLFCSFTMHKMLLNSIYIHLIYIHIIFCTNLKFLHT